MKKLLPLFYFLLMLGCEDKEEELGFTVYSLPTEFPLDKEYSWEYERKNFGSRTEWEYELTPDTTYLDTLHVLPTENGFAFYWWVSGFNHWWNENYSYNCNIPLFAF